MFGTEGNTIRKDRWDFMQRYDEWLSQLRSDAVSRADGSGQEARNRLQEEAVSRLLANRRLLVQWGTGTGKSRVAIHTIRALKENGAEKMMLLVAEDTHKGNWRREFVSALGEKEGGALYEALTVECYQSLRKYDGTSWDYIVADEAHHLRSELRRTSMSSLKADYVLCLSATMSDRGDGDELLRTLGETFGKFDNMEFSTQDSIDKGIIAVPTVHVHVLPIEEISPMQTIEIPWGGKEGRISHNCSAGDYVRFSKERTGGKKILYRVTGTAKETYDIICNEIDRIQKEFDTADANIKTGVDVAKWEMRKTQLKNRKVNFGGIRKQLLGESKTLFVYNLIQRIWERRFICFCTNVKQGEWLGGDFSVNATKKKTNEEVIMGFNRKEHNQLFAVGMMKEGQNLNGIEEGIIVQLGGKERSFIQEFGRVLRSSHPVQHVVVLDGTNDVDFFFNSLANVNPDYIRLHIYSKKQKMESAIRNSVKVRLLK